MYRNNACIREEGALDKGITTALLRPVSGESKIATPNSILARLGRHFSNAGFRWLAAICPLPTSDASLAVLLHCKSHGVDMRVVIPP